MKKTGCFLLALLLLSCPAVQAEEAVTEIYTVEDLLAMADDARGHFVLMADLDMEGVVWVSPDFSGYFDGNGHTILNLTLSQTSGTELTCYDGNCIGYSGEYCGLFATLTNATVKDLKLLNVQAVLESDSPVFLGGITGYMVDSTISGCTVTGCLELRAYNGMFGVGGLAGYGWGTLENCSADMTLICVDTDPNTLDEQFLGGAYGAGFICIEGCDIALDGYISDHGYVHSGGVVGMYLAYPTQSCQMASICNTRVSGKITFFEHNANRRAYCKALIGETLYSYGKLEGNATDFVRDERFEYTQELRPCMCDAPEYAETVVPSSCLSYGYTEYVCQSCGYCYREQYTLLSHNYVYTVAEPADTEREGVMTVICSDCGESFTQIIPKLEAPTDVTEDNTPAPQESPTVPETLPSEIPSEPTNTHFAPIILGAVILFFLGILIVIPKRRRKPGKFEA